MHTSIFIQYDAINQYIENMQSAQTFEEATRIYQKEIETMGFNYFTYWLTSSINGQTMPFYISTYRQDFSEYYITNDLKNKDPIWSQVNKQVTPFSWQEIINRKLKEDSEEQQIVFNSARDFDMRSGGTIPLYGPGKYKGGLTITCNEEQLSFDVQFKKYIGYINIISSYLHEKMIEIITNLPEQNNETTHITQREKEVMVWSARGKTQWEISRLLNISESTVKNHIQNVCRKYNTVNKVQAVAHAIISGDIHL